MKRNDRRTTSFRWGAACCAALAGLALAAEEEAPEKEVPPLKEEEIRLAADQEILPLPGEVLSVLKKRESTDWKAAVEQAEGKAALDKGADLVDTAIRLGVRTADAFLAIQAEERDLLKKAVEELLPAAEKLGAGEELVRLGKEFNDKVSAGSWTGIVALLDATHSQAVAAIKEVGDDESVAIAAAAGWLRGVEIYATTLSGDYDEGASRALRQDGLVRSLVGRLSELPEERRKDPRIAGLQEALEKIKGLAAGEPDAAVPEEAVGGIAGTAGKALEGK